MCINATRYSYEIDDIDMNVDNFSCGEKKQRYKYNIDYIDVKYGQL